jgi:hypothetical protein
MADFIDFLEKAQNDEALIKRFLEQDTAADFKKFFEDEGIDEIDLEDCVKVAKIKKNLPPGGYPSY